MSRLLEKMDNREPPVEFPDNIRAVKGNFTDTWVAVLSADPLVFYGYGKTKEEAIQAVKEKLNAAG